jgi:glutathione S-transferase
MWHFGMVPPQPQEEVNFIMELIKNEVKSLNSQLKGKSSLIGDNQTIVDLYLDFILIEAFQFLLDANLKNSLVNLTNHFKKFIEHENTIKVFGKIKSGKKALVPPAIAAVSKKAEKKQGKNPAGKK